MNELATKQMCVLIRGGIEVWVDATEADKVQKLMETQKYIKLRGSVVATFDISGIYTPEHMEERKRRLDGQWRCRTGTWHEKQEKCECKDELQLKRYEARRKEYEELYGKGVMPL